jgi:hypothetical protein
MPDANDSLHGTDAFAIVGLERRFDLDTASLAQRAAERAAQLDASAERTRLLAVAANLFRLLGNADNGVVLRERRRQIRETLNALKALQNA